MLKITISVVNKVHLEPPLIISSANNISNQFHVMAIYYSQLDEYIIKNFILSQRSDHFKGQYFYKYQDITTYGVLDTQDKLEKNNSYKFHSGCKANQSHVSTLYLCVKSSSKACKCYNRGRQTLSLPCVAVLTPFISSPFSSADSSQCFNIFKVRDIIRKRTVAYSV